MQIVCCANCRMFETRSDVMAMFEQFRSVDKADLSSSRALENHALLVMNKADLGSSRALENHALTSAQAALLRTTL